MIITGQLSVDIKNPIIDQWDWANNIYDKLCKWKREEFDKKVENDMRMNLVKAKLLADTKQKVHEIKQEQA